MACKHINNTKEHYQITREQMNKKGTENFQKKKKNPENNSQNGDMYIPINSYFKCK